MTMVSTDQIELRHPVIQLLNRPEAMQLLRSAVPQGVSPSTVLMETYYAIQKNPDIGKCTPASIVRAVSLAAKTGLIIGETVHLVPFNVSVKVNDQWKKEMRLEKVNDYKGDIELVTRTGAARSVIAKCVYQKEIDNNRFDYQEGTNTSILHRPILVPDQRGMMVGAYAVATISMNLPPIVVWMHLSEIEAIRAKSQAWKPEKVPVCPTWYAKKTAIKQVVKFLSKNSKIGDIRELFDAGEPLAAAEEAEIEVIGTTRDAQTRATLDDDSSDLRFPGEPGYQDDRDLLR